MFKVRLLSIFIPRLTKIKRERTSYVYMNEMMNVNLNQYAVEEEEEVELIKK
jgi:hypothetical protein